jgi:predicted negative regulator of RcsB-dependent stress response
MADTRPAKLDTRLKEVHQSDLTEGRINQDFVEWLKSRGVNYLLVVLVALCAYLGWVRWRSHKTNYQAEAWREFISATQMLPSSLEDVASKYNDVGAVPELARLSAASKLLRAVQSGKALGAATPPAPTPDNPNPIAPPTPDLTAEERTDYLSRADRLYSEVASDDDQSPGRTLLIVTALTGRAAIAESSGKFEEARSLYEQAAKRSEAKYPEIAAASRKRAADVNDNQAPTTMPTQAEVQAVQSQDAQPPGMTPVDVLGWVRTMVMPDEPVTGSGAPGAMGGPAGSPFGLGGPGM